MNAEVLSQREMRRYIHQIELPEVGVTGQEKIKQSKVLIIGAGGKGTMLLLNLAASGIGTLGIADNTVVTEEFLPNQRLFGDADLGKQKAILSKQKLKEINHLVHIELHNICLTKSNIANALTDYDIIADASDNFSTHYLINDAAVKLNKPFVYGGFYGAEAEVTVFNYKNGPTFRCLYPSKPKAEKKPDFGGLVSIGVLTNVTGTIMANEVLKIILGFNNNLSGKLLKFNLSRYSIEIVNFKRNPDSFSDIL